jgi:hypothetical protein
MSVNVTQPSTILTPDGDTIFGSDALCDECGEPIGDHICPTPSVEYVPSSGARGHLTIVGKEPAF